VNILCGYSGYFLVRPRRVLRRRSVHHEHAAGALELAVPVDAPVAAAVACALGRRARAIVFRVKGIRGEVFALLTLAVTFVIARSSSTRRSTRQRRLARRRAVAGDRPHAIGHLLSAGAGRGDGDDAGRLGHRGFEARCRLFAIHDDEDAPK